MISMADKKRNVKDYERIFEEEFYPNADALYNFAFNLTYSEADANDLVQETYLKAYRFIDKYIEGTNAKAWLFKILKNAFINQYRKESKRPSKVDFEGYYKIGLGLGMGFDLNLGPGKLEMFAVVKIYLAEFYKEDEIHPASYENFLRFSMGVAYCFDIVK